MPTGRFLNFAPVVVALSTACVTGAAVGGGPAYIELAPGGRVVRQGVWRPARDIELAVRVRCDGENSARACRVEIAEAARSGERLLASEPCGMAMPFPGVDTDRTVLILVGEDARGGWRQAARWVAERRAIQWTRRRYDDGM
ncbi:MAG: hypothetical protein JNK05_18110 [Myxococcales bacterium]|nr:hypothetical protein [Myxococcales bacterium]